MTINQAYSLMSTSAPAPDDTAPTNDPDDDSISALLSSSGSPPLIVAFLAIGLFIVAMLAVFAWRRMSRSRRAYPQSVTPLLRPKHISLGKRPILVDVWPDPQVHEKAPLGATRWEHTTPLAVVATRLIPPEVPPIVQCPSIGSPDPDGRVLSRTLRRLVFAVKRFYFAPPPSPTPAPEPAGPEKAGLSRTLQTSDEIELADASSLQVTIIITMPAQRRCRSGTEEEAEFERTTLGEFCIGTTDVPWSD